MPKVLAVTFFLSCTRQKHKPNLFSFFKFSKYFSRTQFYTFQLLKTSSIHCFLNFKLQKHQAYFFLAFHLTYYPSYVLFWGSLLLNRCAVLFFFIYSLLKQPCSVCLRILKFKKISGTILVVSLCRNNLILPFFAF